MKWRLAAALTLVVLTIGGCGDDKLVVALGQPASVTAGASSGLDPEPSRPGWEPGQPYVVSFQEFESVTVRFAGAVVLETGSATAGFAVSSDGTVDRVTINVDRRVPTKRRDALVQGTYAELLARGWRYWGGDSADVVGAITPARWRRCLVGYSDDSLSDDSSSPGNANLHAAHFDMTVSGKTARIFNVFGCRLDDDDEPFITQQFHVYFVERR